MRLSENCEPWLLATRLSWRGGFDDGFFIIKGVYDLHSYSNIAIVSCLYGEVLINDKVINDSVRILSRMCEYVFIA